MKKKKTTPTSYISVPFEDIFLKRIEELTELQDLVTYSVRGMNGLEKLNEALKHDDERVKHAAKIETLATSEIENDFPLLYNSTSILLWGALESSVRDFIVRMFIKYPETREIPELVNIKIRIVEYEKLDLSERMRYLLEQYERELSATFKPGIGRFDCLLSPLNLKPQINDQERKNLNELSAIRNVLVHCAGKVDGKLLKLCPWLKYEVGEDVRLGDEDFIKYFHSAINYVVSILKHIDAHPIYSSCDNKQGKQ